MPAAENKRVIRHPNTKAMWRELLHRLLPTPRSLRQWRALRHLGAALYKPDLWHLNRRSVAGAVVIGLFFTWFPAPGQMLFAALAAIKSRSNLPLSIALVWISNPLTIPPLFYFAYRIGCWLLGLPPLPIEFELSWDWLLSSLLRVWQPLVLGSIICGTVSAVLGYASTHMVWRLFIWRALSRRRERSQKAQPKVTEFKHRCRGGRSHTP